MNEEVKNLYNDLFNSKEALSEDEFLDKLIKIENITKYNIFRNLLTYTDKNNLKDVFKLYGEQIVKSKSVLRNKLERQSLNNLIGENITIGDILDKYIQRIKTVFSQKTSLDDKLSSLKITYDYIDGVIFPPEGDTRIIPGSGKGLKVKEGYDRVGLLFNDILNVKNNIYLGDFRVVIGKDDKNSLRQNSYIVVEIPKLNRTIFVNNKYGEATYIYDGIPSDKDLLTKGKESLKNECTKISFHNANQWRKQILESLFKEDSTEKKSDFKNIKAKNLKDALNMEEKKETIRTILNEKQTKEKRFSTNYDERIKFKLDDETSYVIIARTFGIKSNRRFLPNNDIFLELSKRIFGEDDSALINFINNNPLLNRIDYTIDSIRNLFLNNDQLKKERFSLNYYQRFHFKLPDGTSYINIARIFGFREEPKDLAKAKIFIELSKKIFGEDNSDVVKLEGNYVIHTVESIKTLFKNNVQLKEQRFSLNAVRRKTFKLNDGTTYTKIARIFGIKEDPNNLFKDKTFIELNKMMFGKNDSDVTNLINNDVVHTIDSIRILFSNNKRLKKERFSLSTSQRIEFKLPDGTSYITIARIFGILKPTEKNYYYLSKNEIFIELSKRIFGEDDPNVINFLNNSVTHTVNSIRIIFSKDKQLKKERFSLTGKERPRFKLPDGTSYIIIAKIFGFLKPKENSYCYLFNNEAFIKLSKKIFGETDYDVIKLANSHLIHNIDSIKRLFMCDKLAKSQRFSLNCKQRSGFKLSDGTGYISIARTFGFTENGNDLVKEILFLKLSKRIFGEDDPNVIELAKRLNK